MSSLYLSPQNLFMITIIIIIKIRPLYENRLEEKK